ncbi:helix-turn-helix domain-containing protein [Paraburkholderia acidisoli]|uniref:Helix-turn-helix domain-containing protein n=1 Tax=Paraburkholderia acidisoli TaxID=2571748 RepID=A0A7Z2JGY4_9BURK|nr:helix-turn-helix domain-containing protein [Paraburkholderia acidisoli]
MVARRLREVRIRNGLSQEKLGVLAGIDEMSASARMNQYERGKHVPDFGTIKRIAAALNVPATYFYAVADDEAALLLRFHQLSSEQRATLIKFSMELD